MAGMPVNFTGFFHIREVAEFIREPRRNSTRFLLYI